MRTNSFGMLCAENAVEVAERIQQMFGDARFTFVTANSYSDTDERFTAIEVQTSQRLEQPAVVEVTDGRVYIPLLMPRTSAGLSTRAQTQQEGREGKPHQYIAFKFDYDKLTLDLYAPAGNKLRWILALEDHDEEEATR